MCVSVTRMNHVLEGHLYHCATIKARFTYGLVWAAAEGPPSSKEIYFFIDTGGGGGGYIRKGP